MFSRDCQARKRFGEVACGAHRDDTYRTEVREATKCFLGFSKIYVQALGLYFTAL